MQILAPLDTQLLERELFRIAEEQENCIPAGSFVCCRTLLPLRQIEKYRRGHLQTNSRYALARQSSKSRVKNITVLMVGVCL